MPRNYILFGLGFLLVHFTTSQQPNEGKTKLFRFGASFSEIVETHDLSESKC